MGVVFPWLWKVAILAMRSRRPRCPYVWPGRPAPLLQFIPVRFETASEHITLLVGIYLEEGKPLLPSAAIAAMLFSTVGRCLFENTRHRCQVAHSTLLIAAFSPSCVETTQAHATGPRRARLRKNPSQNDLAAQAREALADALHPERLHEIIDRAGGQVADEDLSSGRTGCEK